MTIQKNYTSMQKLVISLSGLLLMMAVLNTGLAWHLLGWSPATFSTLAIFIASVLLWIFVALDWPSLLCIVALGLIPEVGMKSVGELAFGNSTFIFLLATFVVTYALNQTSFLARLTAKVLNHPWVKAHPQYFVTVLLTFILGLACFFSPTVLFMFVFPLYEEICQALKYEKGSSSAAHLLFAVYTVIAIGTAMTPINHVFAITAMGAFESATGQAIGNWEYMGIGLPTGILIYLGLLFVLKYLYPIKVTSMDTQDVTSLRELPEMTQREKLIIGAYGLMIAMWLLPEMLTGILPGLAAFFKTVGIAFPPLVMMIALALIQWEGQALVSIPKAMKEGIHWPSLFLVAATMALGSVIANPDMGVVTLIQGQMTQWIANMNLVWVIVIFVAWAGIQTNFSSNLVTTTMVTTVAMSLFANNQTELRLSVLSCLIGFMASMAMMTPPSMPYVSISIGSGWIKSRQSFIMGLIILVISILMASIVGYVLAISR